LGLRRRRLIFDFRRASHFGWKIRFGQVDLAREDWLRDKLHRFRGRFGGWDWVDRLLRRRGAGLPSFDLGLLFGAQVVTNTLKEVHHFLELLTF
jgi:hypothetical protein